MKVFLTGGTGYLGSRLAEALVAAGHEVTGLARSAEKGVSLEALGLTLALGDVADFDSAAIDFKGFDAVIHTAALVRVRASDKAEFDRVNVQGVGAIAKQALEAGVPRFIYTSSFMALGCAPSAIPLDESVIRDGAHVHNDYERTKYLGLLEFNRWVEKGLPGVALFPCVIYGPGAVTSGNLVSHTIADVLKGRLPGVLGDGKQVWTYSYIEDVVRGHLAALEKGRAGESYILGGESASMEEFVTVVSRMGGVKAPLRHVPFWLAKIAAVVEEMRARIANRDPNISREVVEVYRHNWVYSSAKAEKDLGYQVTKLETGLARTVDWVKAQIEQGKIR